MDSGHAHLRYVKNKDLSISNKSIPYSGTLIIATIDFSQPHLLANALKFKGKKHTPTDFVETAYETNEDR